MMRYDEIMELAEQDVLGLLDHSQRSRLEELLFRADSETREAVRRLQDELCSIHLCTTGPAPLPNLKDKVISRLESLIAEQAVAQAQDATLARIESLAAKNDWFERFVAGRVSPAWRIAALVAFTTAIAFGGLAYTNSINNHILTTAFQRNHWDDYARKALGADAQDYLAPGTLHTGLTSTLPKIDAWGRMMSIPGNENALLLVNQLPKSDIPYEVQVRLPGEDKPRTLTTFESDGTSMAIKVDMAGIDPTTAEWFVLGSRDGKDTDLVMFLSSESAG